MFLVQELNTMMRVALAPIRGATHLQRPESSCTDRVGQNDSVRRRRLCGLHELLEHLPFPEGGVWIDLGGGAGANLEMLGDRLRQLQTVYLVDSNPSLLRVARNRILRHGWSNVTVLEEDPTRLPLRLESADVITFSYALTKMPDWYLAMENAFRLLKPGGHVGVVDFYVSRKQPAVGRNRHSALTRWFWPWWFAGANVFLNPDHVPYLHQLFEPVHFSEGRGRMPKLPMAQVPYYQFVGRK